jgi:hypothetical protein
MSIVCPEGDCRNDSEKGAEKYDSTKRNQEEQRNVEEEAKTTT